MTAALPDNLRISPAQASDVALILAFIRKLAEYERLSHEVVADESILRQSLFAPNPAAEVLLAYVEDEPVGFAVYFRDFSTFAGRPGLYLEDVFVDATHRGKGIGTALLAYIAKTARERGYERVNWAVLDWNRPAVEFYRRLGAVLLDDWRICQLSGVALDKLAAADTSEHVAR